MFLTENDCPFTPSGPIVSSQKSIAASDFKQRHNHSQPTDVQLSDRDVEVVDRPARHYGRERSSRCAVVFPSLAAGLIKPVQFQV